MSTQPTQRRKAMLTVPKTILACLAAVAIAATSAAAGPAARNVDSPAGLQHDLDALVAAGAPGAILLVRDGDHTTRLAAGLGDLARKTPMRAENHFKIASLTKTFTATVLLQLVSEGKLSLDDSVRAASARRRAERQQDHDPPVAQPHERPLRLRARSALPEALSGRQLRPLLVAAPARRVRRLAQAAVCARARLLVLEHELRRRSADHREGDRTNDRCRVRTQDLRAAPPSPDELPDEARVAQPVRARLHAARPATLDRRDRAEPVDGTGLGRHRLDHRTTSPTSTGLCSPDGCSSRRRCGR